MTRITISKELTAKLEKIKDSQWNLITDRGLETTLSFLIDEYQTRESIEKQIENLTNNLETIIGRQIEKGLKEALRLMIQNIISFGEPQSSGGE